MRVIARYFKSCCHKECDCPAPPSGTILRSPDRRVAPSRRSAGPRMPDSHPSFRFYRCSGQGHPRNGMHKIEAGRRVGLSVQRRPDGGIRLSAATAAWDHDIASTKAANKLLTLSRWAHTPKLARTLSPWFTAAEPLRSRPGPPPPPPPTYGGRRGAR